MPVDEPTLISHHGQVLQQTEAITEFQSDQNEEIGECGATAPK